MPHVSILLLVSAALSLFAGQATAADTIAINPTANAPMFDGRCGDDEWSTATKIELPSQVSIYLMHDEHALFFCAKGKAEDYTVIDVYIEDADTGYLHNLHASAQLSERLLKDKEWGEPAWWQLDDWTGFWVPYAGEKETENGPRTAFLEGSHREIEVLRRKFAGNTWTMMVSVSAVKHEGSFTELTFPDNAVDTEASTWATFSFSE